MPDHLKRYQDTGNLHFVTFSCCDRQPCLSSQSAKETFLRSLESARQHYEFCVFSYVIMPEHVHLLLSEPKTSSLATALQALKISVSKQLPEKPFWQRRYYDFNVFSRNKHIEKLKYIHRNPVHRGLVENPQDWLWSSFNHYASGFLGVVEVESDWTTARREGLTLPPTWPPPTSTGKERR